jgi:FMN phosphatase YigB (HAD superfamily)
MNRYRHLFFDLDNTLWDFERNSRETLTELYEKYRLQELGISSFETFIDAYHLRNEMLWNNTAWARSTRRRCVINGSRSRSGTWGLIRDSRLR